MPKPPSNLPSLAETFPHLQRTIERASGLQRTTEIVDILSGCLDVEPKAFERSWFRWRQGGKPFGLAFASVAQFVLAGIHKESHERMLIRRDAEEAYILPSLDG